jgi:hypothetical protein
MPWTAVMIYLRDRGDFPEIVCADSRFAFHHNQNTDLPHAERSDSERTTNCGDWAAIWVNRNVG